MKPPPRDPPNPAPPPAPLPAPLPAWARHEGAPAGAPPSTLLLLKAVPGASRDQLAGPLGARFKVRVSAPPEGGQANRAIVALLAGALGVPARDISIVQGQSNPEKQARVVGLSAHEAAARLTAASSLPAR